jgi:hypothetical protein
VAVIAPLAMLEAVIVVPAIWLPVIPALLEIWVAVIVPAAML